MNKMYIFLRFQVKQTQNIILSCWKLLSLISMVVARKELPCVLNRRPQLGPIS